MTRIYYHDTPKPLAVYRHRLDRGDDAAECRKDLYGEVRMRWKQRGRLYLYRRHEHQIIDLALREMRRRYE